MTQLTPEDRAEMIDAGVPETVVAFLAMAMDLHDLDPSEDVEFLYGADWAVVGFAYFVDGQRTDFIVRPYADVRGDS